MTDILPVVIVGAAGFLAGALLGVLVGYKIGFYGLKFYIEQKVREEEGE